jgi:hypothetical protein
MGDSRFAFSREPGHHTKYRREYNCRVGSAAVMAAVFVLTGRICYDGR